MKRAYLIVLVVALLVAAGLLGSCAGKDVVTLQQDDKTLWGEAVNGVQVRLTAEKSAWPVGEKPVFKMEVRNSGKQEMWYSEPLFNPNAVEMDGVWTNDPGRFSMKSRSLPPGQAYDERIEIVISFMAVPSGKVVELSPGKHTIRVAFFAFPSNDGTMAVGLRSISNPVEITIENLLPGEQDDD